MRKEDIDQISIVLDMIYNPDIEENNTKFSEDRTIDNMFPSLKGKMEELLKDAE